MAQPTQYDRQYSFTTLASTNPSEPYTGAQLDAEFNAVKVTLDELLANIALVQRDDGDLANQSVGPDQLAASLSIGINPPSQWATATAYSLYDTVFNGTVLYKCLEAHTSGTFSTDLAAEKWELLAEFDTATISDNAVTTAKINDLAVTSAKLATAAVTTAKIATNAVTTAKVLDANITVDKLASNAVSTDKIQDAAVTTAKLADAALTAVGALTPAADKFAYYTGSSAAALADLTSFARSLLDDSTAATARTTLGLTAVATAAVASQAQAEAGTDTATVMNPLRVAQAIAALATSSALVGIQAFKTAGSGTYTPTSGAAKALLVLVGPGGNGGASANVSGGKAGGGGGSAGEIGVAVLTSLSEVGYVVGAPGTATQWDTGGTPKTAAKGNNGATGANGRGAPGAAATGGSGCDLYISGAPGGVGTYSSTPLGGYGAASLFGDGGYGGHDGTGTTKDGGDGVAPGSGGGGGGGNGTYGNGSGGGGADGMILVIEFAG